MVKVSGKMVNLVASSYGCQSHSAVLYTAYNTLLRLKLKWTDSEMFSIANSPANIIVYLFDIYFEMSKISSLNHELVK